MEIKVVQKSSEKASFLIKGVSSAFVNELRRSIISLTPVMAIKEVEIKNNSSVFYDEMLAHRFGLVPLKTDLKGYNLPQQCSCKGEGCARCQTKLTLKVKGPNMVYASDLKPKDPKIKPVYPKMVIAKLLKDQEIQLVATAVLGQGRDHVKWSPGLAYYKQNPQIKILKQPAHPQEFVKVCPQQVFEVKNNKVVVNEKKLLNCHLCQACLEAYPNLVEVKNVQDEFIFYLESWGQLEPKEIILAALENLDSRLDELKKVFDNQEKKKEETKKK